jgi:hypothetical protein
MSAEIDVKVEDQKFGRAMLLFGAYKYKKLPDVIRAQARLMAVNLAHNTQPYGKDEVARFKGQNAVRRDLNKVFIPAERVREIAVIGARYNAVSRLLLYAVDVNNPKRIQDAWHKLTGKIVPVERAPSKAWHKSQRNSRGRVRGKGRPMIVMASSALRTYTRAKEKLVGFAKSGWAACARALDGTRGIPGWVTRNKGPGKVKDMTGDKEYPRIRLTNEVNYADKAITESQIGEALRMQREKMEKSLQISLDAEAKAAGFS